MDYRNTTEIKANPKNPRVIKDEKFAKLVQSLKDFPEMLEKRPLVCFTDTDKKLVVLGGNMRLKAANELGLKKMPVILADDWTEEQKAQFLIKDNVSFGEWDYDSLANEWDVEQLEDWGLNIPNYDTTIDDIEEVDQFNESVSFTIKCDSITQLEQLQTKLNTSGNKLSFEDFLIKAGL